MAHKKANSDREKDDDPIRSKLDPQAKKAYDLMFPKHYMLTATVFAYVLGNLVVFVGLGYLLDMQFGTKPVFIFVGFVLSFISTQYCLYRKFKNL